MKTQTAIYRREQSAIETLRQRYASEPQKTLARRIISRDHLTGDDAMLAAQACGNGVRSFFSIYSVIRRFDKRVRHAIAGHLPAGTVPA